MSECASRGTGGKEGGGAAVLTEVGIASARKFHLKIHKLLIDGDFDDSRSRIPQHLWGGACVRGAAESEKANVCVYVFVSACVFE